MMPPDSSPSILGLTAAAFVQTASRHAHMSESQARMWYRRVMRFGAEDVPDVARATPLPVVERLEEDGVVKLGQRTHDGHLIESVVLPMPSGVTLCISSQIGCRMGCCFCRTAGMGLVRNLEAWEIVSQVWTARHLVGATLTNLVFMGMGEPMDNMEHVMTALEVLSDQRGFSFSKSSMMVSTCGLVPGMQTLAQRGWKRLNLAVSLNAPDDAVRDEIMPINRAYPMSVLRQEMQAWPRRHAGVVCIEYVLLSGVNDSEASAKKVAAYLDGLRTRVHVIAHNPHSTSPYLPPDEERVTAFLGWMRAAGLHATRRISRGQNILAACGQLASSDGRMNTPLA